MKQSTMQQIRLAASRESQREQGYFDERFVERTIPSKKNYNRKQKHKKSDIY